MQACLWMDRYQTQAALEMAVYYGINEIENVPDVAGPNPEPLAS